MKNKFFKNLIFYVLLIIIMFTSFGNVFNHKNSRVIPYSEFLNKVEDGQIKSVLITKRGIISTTASDSSKLLTYPPEDNKLIENLRKHNVAIKVAPPESYNWLATLIFQWILPFGIIMIFWMFIMNRAGDGGNKAISFGKSKANLVGEEDVKERFTDVAGCDEAKEELKEVIEFLKEPEKFQKLGGRIPRGILLVGPPGTGKTLLAKAVAGEAGVPFFTISGSDFVEMFVGVGASRVRDLFAQGKKMAPCIIFIDELDAVGRHRGTGIGGGHDEREQTLNQLLVEMDGFEDNDNVILIAATNRPDVLDPALLRPGRFDREVTVDFPDLKGRIAVLKVHTKKVPLASDVDLEIIARGTPGLAGADLENIVNEAAIRAAKLNQNEVTRNDFEFAKDKVMMGTERVSRIMSDEEKKVTAFHEAGHALVTTLLDETDPVHKVTIIPRGRALGITHQLPEMDRYHYSKTYFLNKIMILMGGRVAEEITFNQMFTGAAHDMSVATHIAHDMVCSWGMSILGPITYGKKEGHVFLGKEISNSRDFSEETAKLIDDEIKNIITSSYDKVKTLLTEKHDVLTKVANLLLEKETITGEDLNLIIDES